MRFLYPIEFSIPSQALRRLSCSYQRVGRAACRRRCTMSLYSQRWSTLRRCTRRPSGNCQRGVSSDQPIADFWRRILAMLMHAGDEQLFTLGKEKDHKTRRCGLARTRQQQRHLQTQPPTQGFMVAMGSRLICYVFQNSVAGHRLRHSHEKVVSRRTPSVLLSTALRSHWQWFHDVVRLTHLFLQLRTPTVRFLVCIVRDCLT